MAVQVFLVRHGQAAAGWDSDPDPGLSPLGLQQAQSVCDAFASGTPFPLFSSPLRRAQQTAAPLSDIWRIPVQIDPAFIEIPAPKGLSMAERMSWLLSVRDLTWQQASEDLWQWRRQMLDRLTAFSEPCIVFTHFMVMNLAAGVALETDRLVHYQPANGSILSLSVGAGVVEIVDLGLQAETRVL